jgi:hypothetical protein
VIIRVKIPEDISSEKPVFDFHFGRLGRIILIDSPENA